MPAPPPPPLNAYVLKGWIRVSFTGLSTGNVGGEGKGGSLWSPYSENLLPVHILIMSHIAMLHVC